MQNRGRERAEGEGRRVSDSGIRQLGQAAWLEGGLIVHLSFSSHSDTLQEEERASLLADKLLLLAFFYPHSSSGSALQNRPIFPTTDRRRTC